MNNGCRNLSVSQKMGEGMDLLAQHLLKLSVSNPEEAGVFMGRRRHLDALQRGPASD